MKDEGCWLGDNLRNKLSFSVYVSVHAPDCKEVRIRMYGVSIECGGQPKCRAVAADSCVSATLHMYSIRRAEYMQVHPSHASTDRATDRALASGLGLKAGCIAASESAEERGMWIF